jgi:hypothetical protein
MIAAGGGGTCGGTNSALSGAGGFHLGTGENGQAGQPGPFGGNGGGGAVGAAGGANGDSSAGSTYGGGGGGFHGGGGGSGGTASGGGGGAGSSFADPIATNSATITPGGGMRDGLIVIAAMTLHRPAAPTGVSATPGYQQASVSFTAPTNDGGSPVQSSPVLYGNDSSGQCHNNPDL